MAERKWEKVPGFDFRDIIYEKKSGVARVTINRPEAYNAFTTFTQDELIKAFEDGASDAAVGVVVFTGAGDKAFCTGGDAKEARSGYRKGMLEKDLMVKTLIREMPKPVIAAVNGYAIGGGQVYQQVCDLSIASENAVFGQVGPVVGSFDPGVGVIDLAMVVGEKKAREIWYLCRRYTAKEALEMGLVNKVVPAGKLEEEVDKWCDEILEKSPGAIAGIKACFNAATTYMRGIEAVSAQYLWKYYASEEAEHWKNAFWQKNKPDWRKFRRKEVFPAVYECEDKGVS
ncbi:MAG: enoyl-CoA hydratase/isomerase family protein [Chloroflexota bacterium]|nr:MAG: enoyl-CoA hydratase/isomerase family protein [Chloroflexota bacterium]